MNKQFKPVKAFDEAIPQVNTDMQNTSRQDWIATYAYYLAQARGFIPGYTLDDWLEAEHAYDELCGLYVSFSL